ncbi:MAG: hypothetical protein M3O88_01030 [Actinomycetota bacterium]|nr:hypothetical protein [Actinomycetota bacterium]
MRTARHVVAGALLAAVLFAPAAASGAAGDLDRSFGHDGVAVTDVLHGAFDTAYGTAQQSNGKIVVAGTVETNAGQRFCVLRYRTNGKLDRSFGGDGRVTTSFGGSFQQARDVAIQEGKIVVAGTAYASGRPAFALARYLPDGTLDPGFGSSGRVLAHISAGSVDSASALLVLPSGDLIVAGSTLSPTSTPSDFAVARFDANGELISSFGGDGTVTVDFGGRDDRAAALTRTAGGGIVLAGSSEVDGSSDFALAELHPNGDPVPVFGTGGIVRTTFGGVDPMPAEALDVVTLPSGKVIAVGSVFVGPMTREHDAALARYRSDGSLDPTFGSGGLVTTDVGSPRGDDSATSVAVQANGKIVTAGTTSIKTFMYDHRFAVTRYLTDGTLDAGFGSDGSVTTDFGNGWDLARDVIVTDDGTILAAGEAGASRGGDIALARYRAA